MNTYKVEFSPPGHPPVSMTVVARDEESAHKAALMVLTKADFKVTSQEVLDALDEIGTYCNPEIGIHAIPHKGCILR